MKRTLFLIALSFACLTSSQADTVSIDFGRSDSQTAGSVNITEKDLKFDAPASTPISTEEKSLVTMQGTVQLSVPKYSGSGGPTDLTVVWGKPLAGTVPSFTGNDYESTELDGLRVSGKYGDKTKPFQKVPDLVITFANLAAGTYSMEILSGWNGPNPMHPGLSFTLGGEGITTTDTSWASKEANSVQTGSWTEKATQTGSTLNTGLTIGGISEKEDAGKNKGVVANASNIIVKEGATLTLTISGTVETDEKYMYSNKINNIKLTSNNSAIPEPTTATLSLLGFATLILRRKRK
ncbi:MAG: PEP-CTERM sorting domain-containing protein [Akkermansia sp.]